MKALQSAYHYTKSRVFNSGSSAVKLASLTKKDKDIKFARTMLKAKNQSIKTLKKVNFKLYNSKLNKNHKLFSQLISFSVKDSPLFKSQNSDLANSLKKSISDFEENKSEEIKKNLNVNGHININPHSKIGRECIAYLGYRK